MAYKFLAHKQLKSILNNVETVHKKDIHDYAGGHLNESVLLMAPEASTRKPWPSAKAPQRGSVPRSQLLKSPSKSPRQEGTMQEVLFQFSMGTAGAIPGAGSTKLPKIKLEQLRRSSGGSKGSLYSQVEDNILVEELEPREIMMPAEKEEEEEEVEKEEQVKERGKTEEGTATAPTMASRDFRQSFNFQRDFIPTYTSGVTKQDQFEEFMAFEGNILRKKEAMEQNVLTGKKAVKHHERRLQRELAAYHLDGMGPNFHRLQIFSNVFDDVIDESPTFNYMLRCIKTEYDNYISRLLDGQTSQHHLLREQLENMTSRGTSRPSELQQAMTRLQSLEDEAWNMLSDNERLRQEKRDFQEKVNTLPEDKAGGGGEQQKGKSVFQPEPQYDLADEVEHVKASILEKLDSLNALRNTLRAEHVPQTVCTHLEQCIKETEIEVQKLLKQNEYFEHSVKEMEEELTTAIQIADTSEKDARRIWRKVNSTRGLPGGRPITAGGDSSDEDDDETKWNWYIS